MSERSLAERVLDGDVRAAARLMRLVDDEVPSARGELETLFQHTGGATILGITGNPGSGKSTLVDKFIRVCREHDQTVGCLAIDPTSPFSGGAILGDRIRMNQHVLDPGVFIRSVATRGNLGGISRSTPAMVDILDAMGFDFVIVETVGVGQDEVDIAAHADTCVVVAVPGLGDDVQAAKAGIMEVADIFVINKADRPGADRLKRELRTMLHLGEHGEDVWDVPVLRTVATTGEGVDALFDAVAEHRRWMSRGERASLRRRARYQHMVRLLVRGDASRRLEDAFDSDDWADVLQAIVDRETSPYQAAEELLSQF